MEEDRSQSVVHPAPDAWLRVCDAAKLLGVSNNTVRRWTDDGRLAAHRSPGGHRRYRRADVLALLESLRVAAPVSTARVWTPRAPFAGPGRGGERLGSLVDTGHELADLLSQSPAAVPGRLAERLCNITAVPVCEVTSLDDDGAHVLAGTRDGAADESRLGASVADEPRRRLAAALGPDQPTRVLRRDDEDLDDDARALLDEHGCDTLIFAPVTLAGRLTGTVELCSDTVGGLEREAGLTAGFAELAAHFLDTSAVVERLLRRERAARDLVELGSTAARTRDVDELLREVAKHLSTTLEAACVDIYGIHDGAIVCVASAGHGREQSDSVGESYRLDDYPNTVRAVETGEPLVITSADDPRLSAAERRSFVDDGFGCQFTVPLFAAGQAVGILDIFDHAYHDFGESLEFITSVGQMIAGWIESSTLVADLERHNRLLAELVELGTLATRSADMATSLRSLGERLMDTIAADTIEVYALRGGRIHYVAGFARDTDEDEWLGWSDELSNYPLTQAALDKRDVFVIPSLDDPRLSDFERARYSMFGYQSEICVPLIVEDRAVGYVDIFDTRPRDYVEFADFLRSAAPVIARALENSMLLDDVRDRAEALRELVLIGELLSQTLDLGELVRLVALRLLVALDAASCDVYRVEGDDLTQLAAIGPDGFDEGVVGRVLSLRDYPASKAAAESGEPLVVATPDDPRLSPRERRIFEVNDVRSSLTLPLTVGGRTIAMVDIDDTRERDFTGHLDFVRNVGRLLAGAFEKAFLLEQLEAGNRDLRQLVDAGLEYGTTLDADEVLYLAARSLCRATGGACCDVYAIEGDDSVGLMSVDGEERDESFPGTRYALDQVNLSRIAMDSLEPVVVRDIETDERATGFERAEWLRFGFRSGATVPLTVRGQVIGFATLFDREPGHFDSTTVIQGLTQAAAQAIANARIHDELEQTAHRLGELTEAGLEFGASLELREVLDSVAARMCLASAAACCDIWSIEDDMIHGLASSDVGVPDPEFPGTTFTLDGLDAAQHVLNTREPLIIHDTATDRMLGPVERDDWAKYEFTSGLLVPLITHGESIGLAELFSHEPRDWGDPATVRGLAQIAAQAIANARAHTQLEVSARRMALMTEAAMEFSSSLDLDETLFKVARRLCDLVDTPNVDINVRRPDGEFYCVMSLTDGERDPAWTGQHVDLEVFPRLKLAMDTGQPVVFTSASGPLVTDAAREVYERFGEKSLLIVPLISKDGPIGSIDLIETRRERDFGADEVAAAAGIAQFAALAIDNARLFDRQGQEARRVRALLDTGRAIGSTVELEEVLAHVTREACLALDVSATSIYDFDVQRGRYVYRSAYEVVPSPETPAEIGGSWDLADHPGDRAIMFSDVPVVHQLSDPDLPPDRRESMTRYDEQTVLNVPLHFGDERLGILRFDVYEQERRFTDDEIELARGIGEQAAIAIANARSHTRLEEALDRMTLMTEASMEFSSSLDLEQTLLAVGNRLCETLDVPDCDINVLQGDQVVCLLSIVKGENDLSWTGVSHPLDEYTASREIVEERAVVRIASLDDPRVTATGRETRTAYGEKSWMTVPLVVKDRVIGMVDLSETRRERVFSDAEVETARAICQVAALAIDNADLYADVQDRKAETEMLNAIAQKATAAMDLHAIVLDVSDELRQVVPFARSSIALFEADEVIVHRPYTTETASIRLADHGEPMLEFGQRLAEVGVVTAVPSEGVFWKDFPDVEGMRSIAFIALVAEGRFVGSLNLLSAEDDAFATIDDRLLARVGTQVSLAVRNALLYRDIKRMHLNNLKALSSALNAKDYYTLGHAARVSAYMVLLGEKLGWPRELTDQVEQAAFLHDIGKIGISDRVLLKPGKLNAEEWRLMRQHPVFSAEIIHTLFDEDLVLGVRHHHERWDGKGYPDRLAGIRVPLIARAMCVVDSYDAMSFQRPYHNALDADGCLKELQRCRASQFDPDLVDAFVEVLADLDARRTEAARIAAQAAARIDPRRHASLRNRSQEDSPEYQEIAAVLREVRDANPPTRYLTTQAKLERRYVTIVDAEEDDRDRSSLGSDIFPDEVLQVLPRVLAGEEPNVNALFADQFGVWITGLAPIRNPAGDTIAVVAADLPPFSGAESGTLRTAGEDSLAEVLQTVAVHSARAEVDTISDGLTGLYNHRYLHERLTEELIRSADAGQPASLLFCDLDHFAEFNEHLGHRVGDNALRSVAHVLEQSIRAVDLAARYGGEEFVVVLLETDSHGAFEVAERIRQRVNDTWVAPAEEPLSVSIGVVTFPADGRAKEELLDKADWAMHVAKRQGRNRVVAFSPDQDEAEVAGGAVEGAVEGAEGAADGAADGAPRDAPASDGETTGGDAQAD